MIKTSWENKNLMTKFQEKQTKIAIGLNIIKKKKGKMDWICVQK